LHELFCTKELCPFCLGQLASCECKYDQLALNEQERTAVEEYGLDDFEEPLRSIVNRWKNHLAAKGRIPFGAEHAILGME
jgi:hypothetical protein